MVQGHLAQALGQMVDACRPAPLSPAMLEETAAALKQVIYIYIYIYIYIL